MELVGYFLGGLGLGIGASSLYYSRVIIRLKKQGFIEYPKLASPETTEYPIVRED